MVEEDQAGGQEVKPGVEATKPGPEAKAPEAEAKAPEDIGALQKALAEEKARAEANLAGWQRCQADFVNYRRRSEEEKVETSKFANTSLVEGLLPALDDLERAFGSLPHKLAGAKWVDGLRMIERKLKAALEAQGLAEIKAVGQAFDPRFHEALTQVKGKEGVVISELQKGYTFRDRVIRPSKVAVGNGEEAGKA